MYIRILGHEIHAEFPSITRGRRWVDHHRDDDGTLYAWVGRFHLVASKRRTREERQEQPDSAIG